jgi:hypothetical protein
MMIITSSSTNIDLKVTNLVEPDYSDPNVTVENWRLIRNGTGLLSISRFELKLECESDAPVKWNVTGEIVR